MANQEHIDLLKQGAEVWNQWRVEHIDIRPDLSRAALNKADLSGFDLRGADLRGADFTDARFLQKIHALGFPVNGALLDAVNLSEANLSGALLIGLSLLDADLMRADLSGADLSGADLRGTDFSAAKFKQTSFREAKLQGARLRHTSIGKAYRRDMRNSIGFDRSGLRYEADFSQADLSFANLRDSKLKHTNFNMTNLFGANLQHADLRESNFYIATLYEADLTGADLTGADLRGVNLVKANLESVNLTGCRIYGVAAWSVNMKNTTQSNLIITDDEEATITVDNLKVAQFIYLLLNNQEIREVIDTITSKAVLILGRFTPERKAVLDAIRDELRKQNYLPILFDFDKPTSRDIHETITTLARLARFVIADITSPKSIPQELVSIVETLPSLPVQPLLKVRSKPWGMFDHIKRYPWVLPLYRYIDEKSLLASLNEKVIAPAEQKVKELAKR